MRRGSALPGAEGGNRLTSSISVNLCSSWGEVGFGNLKSCECQGSELESSFVAYLRIRKKLRS